MGECDACRHLANRLWVAVAVVLLAIGVAPGPVAATDLGLVDADQGLWHLRDADGSVNTFYFGDPHDTPFAGDWDCDGDDTPGLYRRSDGFAYLRNSNTSGVADVRFFFGDPADLPLAGDFDGDGCDTLSLYRPSTQEFFIINDLGEDGGGLGAADFSFVFGNPGDKPFVGDFDADGFDEVGLHRESTSLVYYRTALTAGPADNQFIFGDPNDRLVAGDWGTPDGADTPAVFRPSDGRFYLKYANSKGPADEVLQFGVGTFLPVAGDWVLPTVQPSSQTPDEPDVLDRSKESSAGEGLDGETSTVDEPPGEGEFGGVEFIAPIDAELPTGLAPVGPPVEPMTVEDLRAGHRQVDMAGLGFVPDLAKSAGGDVQASFCHHDPLLDNNQAAWCNGLGIFPSSNGWLAYNSLPYGVGQLVGVAGNQLGPCSATLVARNVVLTAAHCVKDIPSFVFWPDHHPDMGSDRQWFGTRRIYHGEYLEGGPREHIFDYALVILQADPVDGKFPGDVLEAETIYMLNAADPRTSAGYVEWDAHRTSLGYPAEGWWHGHNPDGPRKPWNEAFRAWPWYCTASDGWYYHFGGGYYKLGFGCQLNGGNSGGPIYQTINGEEYVVSVVSTGSHIYKCTFYLRRTCPVVHPSGFVTDSNRYFGYNVWGPPLLRTSGAWGFDDLWWAAFNTSIDGPFYSAR